MCNSVPTDAPAARGEDARLFVGFELSKGSWLGEPDAALDGLLRHRPALPVPDPRQRGGTDNGQRSGRDRPDRRPVHRLRRRHRLRLRHLQRRHEHSPRGREQPDPRQRPELDLRRPHRLRRDHDVPARRQLLGRPAARHAGRDVGRRHGKRGLHQRHHRDRPRRRGDRRAHGARHADRHRRADQQRTLHGSGEPRRGNTAADADARGPARQ